MAWWGPGVTQIDRVWEMWVHLPPSPRWTQTEGVAPQKQCPHGLIVRLWQAAYDGQRDVTGRAGLMVSRSAPVHEGRTGMLHPPAPGRRIQQ